MLRDTDVHYCNLHPELSSSYCDTDVHYCNLHPELSSSYCDTDVRYCNLHPELSSSYCDTGTGSIVIYILNCFLLCIVEINFI